MRLLWATTWQIYDAYFGNKLIMAFNLCAHFKPEASLFSGCPLSHAWLLSVLCWDLTTHRTRPNIVSRWQYINLLSSADNVIRFGRQRHRQPQKTASYDARVKSENRLEKETGVPSRWMRLWCWRVRVYWRWRILPQPTTVQPVKTQSVYS
jgi:hypothetical protein